MCFRPPDASAPAHCPECGKKINKTQGMYPKKCPFCKTSFEGIDLDALALEQAESAGGAASALGAPKAPGAPAAPGAPKAPGAPGAPKAPSAPGMPR